MCETCKSGFGCQCDVRRAMLEKIMPGDRVTILVYSGIATWKEKTGRAVMRGPNGYVLNMGGRYGSPAVASLRNLVKVVHRGKTANYS